MDHWHNELSTLSGVLTQNFDNRLGNWTLNIRDSDTSHNRTQTPRRVGASTEDQKKSTGSLNSMENEANKFKPQKPRQNKRACQAKAKLSTQAAPGAPTSWKPRPYRKTKPRTPKTNTLRLTTTYLLAAPCDFIRPENRVSYLHWERPSDSESLRANHSAHPVITPATIGQGPHQLLIEATAGDSSQSESACRCQHILFKTKTISRGSHKANPSSSRLWISGGQIKR